jgi:hypothetical protein
VQYCPLCGSRLQPGKKFCTSCGASLRPDVPGISPSGVTSAGPAYTGSSGRTGWILPAAILAAAGLILLLVIVVIAAYPAITGSYLFPFGNRTNAPAPLPTPEGMMVSPGGSYAVAETETPAPELTPLIPDTTPVPTTLITTSPTPPPVTKAVFCASDRVRCNNQCVDILTDIGNCGYCNTSCSPGQFCLNGNCRINCTAGQTSCPDGCFDIQSHAKHCGSCGNTCPRGLICSQGTCTAPATPMLVPE